MAALKASWKVDPSSSSSEQAKETSHLAKEGLVEETIESNDNHLASLISAIDRVQQKVNDELTTWKDALGHEQIGAGKDGSQLEKQGARQEGDEDEEDDSNDEDEDEV